MDALSAIVGDYRWLPFRLDVAGNRLSLVRADRDAHRAATFLDDQLLQALPERQDVTLQALGPALAQLPPNPCHFLFHSAFCCSTLLARALDVPGRAMALKEPLVLNDLAQAALAAGVPGAVRGQLEPILSLLARPFAPGETVVVKPSNVVNPLIDEILELRPASKALLLSSELPDFLRSVAKKGLWGRIWARKTMSSLSRLPQLQSGFSEVDRWEQSDLQVAALVWLDHRAQFAQLLTRLPAGRVASLDSADLLGDPARALAAVSEYFGLGLAPDAVAAIASGPVFTSNAKRHDEAFDAERRRDEHAAVGDLLAEEIELVTQWAESVGDFAGVPKQLPRPLLG
ncbi:MAG: hypothetical protein ABI626_09200 [Sphingomicrobium sp.]